MPAALRMLGGLSHHHYPAVLGAKLFGHGSLEQGFSCLALPSLGRVLDQRLFVRFELEPCRVLRWDAFRRLSKRERLAFIDLQMSPRGITFKLDMKGRYQTVLINWCKRLLFIRKGLFHLKRRTGPHFYYKLHDYGTQYIKLCYFARLSWTAV